MNGLEGHFTRKLLGTLEPHSLAVACSLSLLNVNCNSGTKVRGCFHRGLLPACLVWHHGWTWKPGKDRLEPHSFTKWRDSSCHLGLDFKVFNFVREENRDNKLSHGIGTLTRVACCPWRRQLF